MIKAHVPKKTENKETCPGRCFFKENGVRCAACDQVNNKEQKVQPTSKCGNSTKPNVGGSCHREENLYTPNCIRTFTGIYVNVFEPTPEMVIYQLSIQLHSTQLKCVN